MSSSTSTSKPTSSNNNNRALVEVKRHRDGDDTDGRDVDSNEIDDYYFWSQLHLSRVKRFKYFSVSKIDWICGSGLSQKEIYTSDDLVKAFFDEDWDCARWMLMENPSLAQDVVSFEYAANETVPILHFLIVCWSVLPSMRSTTFLSFMEWLIVEHPLVLEETFKQSDPDDEEIRYENSYFFPKTILASFDHMIHKGSPLHWWNSSIPSHILDLMIENSSVVAIRKRDDKGRSFLHRMVETESLLESSIFDFRHVVSKCLQHSWGLDLLKAVDYSKKSILHAVTNSERSGDLSQKILDWYIKNIPEIVFWRDSAGLTPIHYLARHSSLMVLRRVLCLDEICLLDLARHSSVPVIRQVLSIENLGLEDFAQDFLSGRDCNHGVPFPFFATLPIIDDEISCYVLNEAAKRWRLDDRHPMTQVDSWNNNGFHWLFVRIRLHETCPNTRYKDCWDFQIDLQYGIVEDMWNVLVHRTLKEWIASCEASSEYLDMSDDSSVESDEDEDDADLDSGCVSSKVAKRSMLIPVAEKLILQCPTGLFLKNLDGESPSDLILHPSSFHSFKAFNPKIQRLIVNHWMIIPALAKPFWFHNDLWKKQYESINAFAAKYPMGVVEALIHLSGMSNAVMDPSARSFISKVVNSQFVFKTIDSDLSTLSTRIAPSNARAILHSLSIQSLIQEEPYQRLINAVMRLNKAGRLTYTHQTMNDRAFGVRILRSVKGESSDDDNASLDGIFLFLRENPVLCNVSETHYDNDWEEEESQVTEEKEDHDCQRRYRQTTLDSWIVQR